MISVKDKMQVCVELLCVCLVQELVVAFGGLVLHYETQFAASALQLMEDEKQRDKTAAVVTGDVPGGWALVSPGFTGSPSHVIEVNVLPTRACLLS